jgi:hypothetical protein
MCVLRTVEKRLYFASWTRLKSHTRTVHVLQSVAYRRLSLNFCAELIYTSTFFISLLHLMVLHNPKSSPRRNIL